MAFELPAVDALSLATWCELHLGSPAETELFRTGHLTRVIGTPLADGREIVVRIRPAAPRIATCTEVQRLLSDSGYPCPQPLAGPAPLGEYEATAESHIAGWGTAARLWSHSPALCRSARATGGTGSCA